MKVAKSSADWGDSMQSLAEFATVEDFWKVYNNVPKPSQVRREDMASSGPSRNQAFVVSLDISKLRHGAKG